MGCINWAWKFQGLKSNQKLLFVAIADRADKETGVCKTPVYRLSKDCGGWARQVTNRVLKQLLDLDLLDIQPLFPGTPDKSRMVILNLAIDPDEWRPPEGKGRKKGRTQERYYVNSHDLRQLLREAAKMDAKRLHHFDDWVSPIRFVEVRLPFIVCGLPDADFARQVWAEWKDLIIKVAAQKVSPKITKLRLIYPKGQPQKRPKQ